MGDVEYETPIGKKEQPQPQQSNPSSLNMVGQASSKRSLNSTKRQKQSQGKTSTRRDQFSRRNKSLESDAATYMFSMPETGEVIEDHHLSLKIERFIERLATTAMSKAYSDKY